jgi:hypothetical protein
MVPQRTVPIDGNRRLSFTDPNRERFILLDIARIFN